MSRNYNDESEKHIKNTDNENTQYIPADSDSLNTSQIYPQNYSSENNRQQYSNGSQSGNSGYYGNSQYNPQRQQQYHQGYGSQTPGRQQYYSSGQQSSRQYSGNRQQYSNNAQSGNAGYYNNAQYSQQRQQSSQNYRSGQSPNYQRSPQQQYNRGNQRPYPDRNVSRQQRPPEQQPKRKKKKKHPIRKLIIRIILVILVLLLIVFGVYSCTALSLIKKLNYSETDSRTHVSGALSESYVTSILLIGTDGRSLEDSGRSDTMILFSINRSTKKIILTSFMRDSYVSIPGYGENKLNHAYAYGGAELLMDTIEQNFNVRIDDYVMVNFTSFASIIDSVDGIDIEISDDEAQEINTILMAELNELMGDAVDDDLLSSGGKVHLNGKQALAYARIRHVGNADFERTERQREVITEAVSKLKSFSPKIISNIAENAIPQITTNMETTELYLLSLKLPFCLGYDIEQLQIPADDTYWSVTTSDGGDALAFDYDANYSLIKENVFED